MAKPDSPDQSQTFLKRKIMYKTSPNWQQIYKQQCLSRLTDARNESRSRLIERFRNIDINESQTADPLDTQKDIIVKEVMNSVWDQFQSRLPPIDVSDITDFMEQIRQELLEEETQYWEEMMEWRKREELEWLVANRESVVCFFCQKNPLEIFRPSDSESKLFCSKCGFSFITQSSLNLEELQRRLDDIVTTHSSICANPSLKFDLINDCSNSGSNNVIVFCEICHKSDLIFNQFQ